MPDRPQVFGFIAGLGGRDVTTAVLEDIYLQTKNGDVPPGESVWVGLQEVSHATGRA